MTKYGVFKVDVEENKDGIYEYDPWDVPINEAFLEKEAWGHRVFDSEEEATAYLKAEYEDAGWEEYDDDGMGGSYYRADEYRLDPNGTGQAVAVEYSVRSNRSYGFGGFFDDVKEEETGAALLVHEVLTLEEA